MSDKLKYLLDKIEEKFDKGSSYDWTTKHFEMLSDSIFEETKIRISTQTLKRLWGRAKYFNTPNINTLDALSSYMGYENWIAFNKTGNSSHKSFYFANSKFLIGGIFISIIILTFAIVYFLMSIPEYTFKSDTKSDTVPFTNKIEMDFSNFHRKVHINRYHCGLQLDNILNINGNSSLNNSVRTPGYYLFVLADRYRNIDTICFAAYTDGWIGTFSLKDHTQYRYIINEEEILDSGRLYFNPEILKRKNISSLDIIKKPKVSLFLKEFENLNQDSLEIIFEFKHLNTNYDDYCKQSNFDLCFRNGMISFGLSEKGCGDINYIIKGNKTTGGNRKDLNSFSYSLIENQIIRITKQGDNFIIYHNDNLIYKGITDYKLLNFSGINIFGYLSFSNISVYSNNRVYYKLR